MKNFNEITNKLDKMNKLIKTAESETDLNKRLTVINRFHILSEKLFLDSRALFIAESINVLDAVFDSPYDPKATEMGIKIFEKDGKMIIELPVLLPFKKLKNLNLDVKPDDKKYKETQEHCNAIATALNNALKHYVAFHIIDRKKYSKAIYVYTHFFGNEFPDKRIPDSDNYEYKQVTDIVVANISNLDDGFENLEFHFKTEKGDRTYTQLMIIPKEEN